MKVRDNVAEIYSAHDLEHMPRGTVRTFVVPKLEVSALRDGYGWRTISRKLSSADLAGLRSISARPDQARR